MKFSELPLGTIYCAGAAKDTLWQKVAPGRAVRVFKVPDDVAVNPADPKATPDDAPLFRDLSNEELST